MKFPSPFRKWSGRLSYISDARARRHIKCFFYLTSQSSHSCLGNILKVPCVSFKFPKFLLPLQIRPRSMSDTIIADKARMEKNQYLNPPPPEQQPPPTYSVNPSDLTAAFSNLTLNLTSRTPTENQCIAHLKLLEAFHQLREDVAMTNGLFGIHDDLVPAGVLENERLEILRRIREKRWAVYVARAALRFEKWWRTSVEPGAVMIRQTDLDAIHPIVSGEKGEDSWGMSKENLPPLGMSGPLLSHDCRCSSDLDVIMVWHSYMLNPRCFLEDCLRHNKIAFWRSGLPWEAIDACIDNNSLEFTGTTQARHLFAKETGLQWDNLNDATGIHIPCPKCKQQMSGPWTTSGNSSLWSISGGELGDGFADKNFRLRCPSCQMILDHDALRVCKFRNDMNQLLLKDVPMPGTLLNIDGTRASMI